MNVFFLIVHHVIIVIANNVYNQLNGFIQEGPHTKIEERALKFLISIQKYYEDFTKIHVF